MNKKLSPDLIPVPIPQTKLALKKLINKQLKWILDNYGLIKSGKKQEMIDRILKHQQQLPEQLRVKKEKSVIIYLNEKPILKVKIYPETTILEILKTAEQFLKTQNIGYNTPELFLSDKQKLENTVLVNPKYQNSLVFKQIINDKSALIYKTDEIKKIPKGFTGNKDTDFIILSNLEDKDLYNFCQTDRYIAKLCQDESFWMNRTLNRFRDLIDQEDIPKIKRDSSWKDFYNDLVNSYKLLKTKYGYEVTNMLDEIGEGDKIKDINILILEKGGGNRVYTFKSYGKHADEKKNFFPYFTNKTKALKFWKYNYEYMLKKLGINYVLKDVTFADSVRKYQPYGNLTWNEFKRSELENKFERYFTDRRLTKNWGKL